MGNTIRRNAEGNDSQRARHDIIRARRAAARDRLEARAYDDRALSARNPHPAR